MIDMSKEMSITGIKDSVLWMLHYKSAMLDVVVDVIRPQALLFLL